MSEMRTGTRWWSPARLRTAACFISAAPLLLAAPAHSASSLLDTDVLVAGEGKISFQSVRVYATKRGVLVAGTVRRASMIKSPLWGHLHITAKMLDRSPLCFDTRWTGNMNGRVYRSASFSKLLRNLPPEKLQSVTIAYRQNRDFQDE